MQAYARLYTLYENLAIKLIRIFIFLTLLIFIWYQNQLGIFAKFPLFFFLLFCMWEIFYRAKIKRMHPTLTVVQNTNNIYDSFTLFALSILSSSNNTEHIIKTLLQEPSILFILHKADMVPQDIKVVQISKETLATNAFKIAQQVRVEFVTTADLFAAYLLTTESQTKLLFEKHLQEEDLLNILLWSRSKFSQEEHPQNIRVHFWGEGIGQQWVSGWTIETQKYMVDMTSNALRQQEQFVQRNHEYEQALSALHKNSSVLLVGEPGSGKDTLVNSIAFDSFTNNLPGNLAHQRFFQLLLDQLLAGADTQGELEKRLDSVIAEIAHSGNVIVYIPNFENILGNATFHTDISGVLIPYLQKGILRIIATVTPSAYQQFVENKKTLTDSLEIVRLEEPNDNKTQQILYQKSSEIEKTYRVSLTYKALLAAITYGKKYVQQSVLPGAAVILLEEAANSAQLAGKKIVEEDTIVTQVTQKVHANIGAPKQQEKAVLLDLENKIHSRVIDQQEAVSAISEAMRRLRSGIVTATKPVSFLFLGPTGVGKTETAKALAYFYFGSDEQMIRIDMSEYGTAENASRLIGTDQTPGLLTGAVANAPFSLVLLDEFEKAHPEILNLFLQVLDDGRLTDGNGKTVSFADSIIIATSNAGSEQIREAVEQNIPLDKNFNQKLLDFLQQQALFKPELLNRFDDIIVFKPLGPQEAAAIAQLFLNKLAQKLHEQDVIVMFDQSLIQKICSEGFDRQFGARPLNRYIQDNIENLIAQKILSDEIQRGAKITVSVDQSGLIIISP